MGPAESEEYVRQAGGRVLDRVVRGVQFVIDQGKHGIEFVFGTQIEASLGFTVETGRDGGR